MTSFEIARKFEQLNQPEDARKAYEIALQTDRLEPSERMDAACYILRYGGDYRIPYTCFLHLYREGFFQDDCFQILTDAFYRPNENDLRKQYEINCKCLRRYPYFFRTEFPKFESLPILFYPYEDGSYVPFFPAEKRFGELVKLNDGIIHRNFFRDLEKPVLAADVYSQYELEYLNDNVRRSEDVARENHVYLHYTDWVTFCSWLQVLNFQKLLKEKKFVFLMEGEIEQYPIDFQERFGIDYSSYPFRRVKIREVNRLIWHAQLSSSNGGDFFNEIFDAHPNLYYLSSVMYDNIMETIDKVEKALKMSPDFATMKKVFRRWGDVGLERDLYSIKDRTQKDILVAIFIHESTKIGTLDRLSRIVPALLIQPHFSNVYATLTVNNKGNTVLDTNVYDLVHATPFFKGFRYVKTFTPIRRFTTSYGSTVKFMESRIELSREKEKEGEPPSVMSDLQMERILNRTYLRDSEDPLFRDSIMVRFEDGKLNPAATFTKLAEFLDLPYTESMTYCSQYNVQNVETEKGNVIGFDPATVYRTFDDYVTDSDRCFIEYFMRDAYQYYGYDFQYYDGSPVDEDRILEWMKHFDRLDKNIQDSWGHLFAKDIVGEVEDETQRESDTKEFLAQFVQKRDAKRKEIIETLQRGLRFVNKHGQPLEMTPMLQPDPALLVQPLYH